MDEREQRLLRALVVMTHQFYGARDGQIWSQGLGAGERAIGCLVEYGLAEPVKGHLVARWTDAGLQMRDSKPQNPN